VQPLLAVLDSPGCAKADSQEWLSYENTDPGHRRGEFYLFPNHAVAAACI